MSKHPYVVRTLTITSLLCASIGLGCASHPAQPSQLPVGQPFELRAGTSAILGDGLKVTFRGVQTDSRCPMDALCIWVGDAIVALSLSQLGGVQAERTLHTHAGDSEASYRSYVIKLVALAPYPRSDRQIRPDDYVATLSVETR